MMRLPYHRQTRPNPLYFVSEKADSYQLEFGASMFEFPGREREQLYWRLLRGRTHTTSFRDCR